MTGLDLKLHRIRHRLRQVDVAAAAGLSRQRISALEQRRRLTDSAAARLVAAIDTAVPGMGATPGTLIDFEQRREDRRRLVEARA